QALATVTLGGAGDTQKSDSITGNIVKSFYLQYTFPPSCVGEVRSQWGVERVGAGPGA
ncbi:unnamed protein product, partial [Discosporangium mesarthrocarpum]